MKQTEERRKRFITHLLGLAREDSPDRGALAELRSGLGKQPGTAMRMHRHVVPYLDEKRDYSDRWFYLVGALFAANPAQDKDKTIGSCFKIISIQSDSIAARFIALLESDEEDLHKHLAYAISLIKSKKLGLNYYRLLEDLCYWSLPERPVQNRWARDFYRKNKSETKEKTNE